MPPLQVGRTMASHVSELLALSESLSGGEGVASVLAVVDKLKRYCLVFHLRLASVFRLFVCSRTSLALAMVQLLTTDPFDVAIAPKLSTLNQALAGQIKTLHETINSQLLPPTSSAPPTDAPLSSAVSRLKGPMTMSTGSVSAPTTPISKSMGREQRTSRNSRSRTISSMEAPGVVTPSSTFLSPARIRD